MVVLRISYVKNIPTPDQVLIRYPRRCQSERLDCYIPEEGAYAISARICGRIQHVGLAATWALYGRMARDPWSQQRVSTYGTPCRDVPASSRAPRSRSEEHTSE